MTAHTIDWPRVYGQWLKDTASLDRIDFPCPARFPGQTHMFEYIGPMGTVRRPTWTI